MVAITVGCLCLAGLLASTGTRTLRVGGSAESDTRTIQAAVELVPSGTIPWTIEVEPGTYAERVHLTASKPPITISGLGAPEDVVLRSACPGGTGDGTTGCTPCAPFNGSMPSPAMRADVTTLLVGSPDFTLRNLTVANDACGYDASRAAQSDAVQVRADRAAFYNCRLLGAQDTLLTVGGVAARSYFHGTFVNGSCDSVYGDSSAVFEQCDIAIVDHVTAHKGDEGPAGSSSGSVYLFVNSRLRKPAQGERAFPARKGGSELGRPWGPLAHVVYKNVWMDDHIAGYGWGDWAHGCGAFGAACASNRSCWCQNVTYAEFNSTGPGANTHARVPWSKQLTQEQADAITPSTVLRDWVPPVTYPCPEQSQ